MEPEHQAPTPIPRQAKLLALFVIGGGVVGGVTVWTAMFVLGAVMTFAGSMTLPDNALLQFLFFTPFAALFGIVLGFPPAFLTGLIYSFGPKSMGRAFPVTVVGAAFSIAWAAAFVFLDFDSGYPPSDPYLAYCALFALGGAVATIICTVAARRWKLAPQ